MIFIRCFNSNGDVSHSASLNMRTCSRVSCVVPSGKENRPSPLLPQQQQQPQLKSVAPMRVQPSMPQLLLFASTSRREQLHVNPFDRITTCYNQLLLDIDRRIMHRNSMVVDPQMEQFFVSCAKGLVEPPTIEPQLFQVYICTDRCKVEKKKP